MINFKVRGIKELESFLKTVPRGTKKAAISAMSEYILGNDEHGLKHYPPKKTQKYERTFTLKAGWVITGGNYQKKISNPVSYTPYVPRWKKYGWREWGDVVNSNLAGALRHAQAAVRKFLQERR